MFPKKNISNRAVCKYGTETGRFFSIDPLWETSPEPFTDWTPNHYCGNDPVNSKDINGFYTEKEGGDCNGEVLFGALSLRGNFAKKD